jgi:hypothetical protein
MKSIFILSVLVASNSFAGSLLDDVKGVFGVSQCLSKKTQTMCLVEDILNKNSSVPVLASTEIFGKSNKYYLTSGSSNWLKIDLSEKKMEDILLVDSQMMGFVEAKFKIGKSDAIDQLSKAPLMAIANSLKSEPEKVEADFWPWVDSGSIYQICYQTNKKTVECMISAAANLPDGHVTLYSVSTSINSVTDSALEVIVSIDLP